MWTPARLFLLTCCLFTVLVVGVDSAQDQPCTEIALLMKVGTRVVRGKNWKSGDQDGGPGSVGTVRRGLLDGLVRVEWDHGGSNSYRMGLGGECELDLAPVSAPVPPSGNTNRTCAEITQLLMNGTRVVRGKDWKWEDQDGGVGSQGTVVRSLVDGLVRVEWDRGGSNSYRMGLGGVCELDLAPDSPPVPLLGNTNQTCAGITQLMTNGTRVIRGRDWKWGDQDGGVGSQGTVVRGLLDGLVRVQWDRGGSNSYRMGLSGQCELDLAPTPLLPPIPTMGNTNATCDEMARAMKIGTKVVRGKDWDWGDQDGGIGRTGVVVREAVNGLVRVQWGTGSSNSYRMGSDGKCDLSLVSVPTSGLSCPELARLMKKGTRVIRGKDWKWDDQDGGIGGVGVVVREVFEGLVLVEWGAQGYVGLRAYRMGRDGKCDLDVDPSPSLKHTNLTCTEIAALVQVGSRVVRGEDWDRGDEDGGPGKVGTITRGLDKDGYLMVEWDMGGVHLYQLNHDGKCLLDLEKAPEKPKNLTCMTIAIEDIVGSPSKNVKLSHRWSSRIPADVELKVMQEIIDVLKKYSITC